MVVVLVVVVKVAVAAAIALVRCLQEVQIRRPKITKEAHARPFQSTLFLVQPLARDTSGGQVQREHEPMSGWSQGNTCSLSERGDVQQGFISVEIATDGCSWRRVWREGVRVTGVVWDGVCLKSRCKL